MTAPSAEGAHVLVTSMKNEGPYILEWVAHHRVLGFGGIYIASNDCSDGTNVMLRALAAAGAIGHISHTVPPGDGAQQLGYQRLRARFSLNRASWLMALDVDEFLSVPVGAGRVQDLTAEAGPRIDVIALSSRTFGTGTEPGWAPERTCRRFTLRVPDQSRENAPVKSLTRGPGRFTAIHNHSMVGFRPDRPVRVLRGNGTVFDLDPQLPIWRQLRNFQPRDIGHALGHYNHYAIRSPGEFMLRQRRGRGVDIRNLQPDQQDRHTEGYFAARANAAVIEDSEILTRYAAPVEAEMAQLMSLPGVAEAQALVEERMRAAMEGVDL